MLWPPVVSAPNLRCRRNGQCTWCFSPTAPVSDATGHANDRDGQRIEPQAISGAAWQMLPIKQIGRIEVLRG